MQESIDAYTSEKIEKKDVIGPYVKYLLIKNCTNKFFLFDI